MKILILGKDGFIGRNLSEYFRDKGYDVVALGHQELDLLDEKSICEYLKRNYYDVIFDAAVYNPRTAKNGVDNKEIEYNLRMFLALEKCHTMYGKLIYFGSGAEYDKSQDMKQVHETDIEKYHLPEYDYGLYKYVIHRLIEKSSNIYNFRVFGLFGPHENWKKAFISGACCKAIKDLPITIRRNVFFDYLYVEDFCKMVEILISRDLKYHEYNLVSGRSVDLMTLAKAVLKVSGKNLPIYVCEEGLGKEYSASNVRVMQELGEFEYEDIENSIFKLYSWYEEHENMIDMCSLLYQ